MKYEKEYTIRLSEDEEKVIEFVSKKLASGKRIQELQLLKRILVYTRGISKIGLFAGLENDLKSYGKVMSKDQQENIIHVMTNEFPAGSGKKTYAQCVLSRKMIRIINQPNLLPRCLPTMILQYFKRACGFWNQPLQERVTVRLMGRQIWCYIRNIHMKMCAVFLTGSKMRCH